MHAPGSLYRLIPFADKAFIKHLVGAKHGAQLRDMISSPPQSHPRAFRSLWALRQLQSLLSSVGSPRRNSREGMSKLKLPGESNLLLHCLDNGDNSNNGVTLGCLLTICYPSFLHLPGGPCLLKEKPRSSVTPKVTHYLPLPSHLSQLIFCHLLFFSATLIFQTQEACFC